jgi:hypothetical protein
MGDYKYVLYATANYGNGHVQEIGRFNDVDDIIIHIGMFRNDVQITIEKQYEKTTR